MPNGATEQHFRKSPKEATTNIAKIVSLLFFRTKVQQKLEHFFIQKKFIFLASQLL